METTYTLDFDDPPALDRATRAGRPGERAVRERLRGAHPVALGLALLWHDHWNAAHEVAQSDEGEPDHDLLHYFVHRREGDFGNAGYWLREVERHPVFARLAPRVEALLARSPLRDKLLPGGAWAPRAFLEAVRRGRGGPDEPLLRALQAEEMRGLWEMAGNRNLKDET